MNDAPIELRRGEFVISTDRARIDPDAALALLRMTHSISFGLFHGKTLIGFGRAVTDLATYAYWTDVAIAEEYRGRGLRRVALTRDAEELYAQVGFTAGAGPLTYMEHCIR